MYNYGQPDFRLKFRRMEKLYCLHSVKPRETMNLMSVHCVLSRLCKSKMASLLLLMVLGIGDIYFTGFKVAANTIVESRGDSLCTYDVNQYTGRLTESGCFLTDRDLVVAVGTDAHDEVLFFSDIFSGNLFRVGVGQGTQTVSQLLYGLGSVEGIAVDWLAKNIFWTDFELNHICVSRYDGTNRTVIVDNLENPRGIAVDPFDGLIFWSDLQGVSDLQGSVERANMDGTRRVAIVSYNLASPGGLVIDFDERRLYFADRGTDKIESVTYDGEDRTVLYEQNSADFFDITIYKDYLYATIWRSSEVDGQVMVIGYRGPNDGQLIQTLDHSGRGLGIATLDEEYQPEELNGASGACGDLNGRCDHLCLPIGNTRRRCACATGYSLSEDGKTCETHHVTDHFLLVVDSSLNAIYQVNASASNHDISTLPLGHLDFPVAVAYDHVDGMVYWTDRRRSAIGRASLDGSVQEHVLFGNIVDPGGVALDTRRRLVYWTDEDKNEIGMAGMDGNLGSRVFIDQGLDEPRAIAVNLINGNVYWTDWGAMPKIERVDRDGSNRAVLVETELGWPNCLALDWHDGLMYWCDAQYDRIEMSDLDGNDRQVLVSSAEQAHPFSLAIYGEFMYWTDWLEHRLLRANRRTGAGVEEVGEAVFLRMQGLTAYEYADTFVEETTTLPEFPRETTASVETFPSTAAAPPPISGALNVTLIAAAAGGGLVLILVVTLAICCIVRCVRSKEDSRAPGDHVPMSVRSTSFVGAYDPNGFPGPGQTTNNNPPPLPPARKKSDPIYQDIEDFQKPGGEAAYQAYLNPAFREEGGDGGGGEKSPRYIRRITPGIPSQSRPEAAEPTPPSTSNAGKLPARANETYMTPDASQEQSYMDLRRPVPEADYM